MSFFTVISCIDGRVQLPANTYLQNRFGVDNDDTVTEAEPVRVLSLLSNSLAARSIFQRADLSLRVHSTSGTAIVAHHDCAGNPMPDSAQMLLLQICLEPLAERYPQ